MLGGMFAVNVIGFPEQTEVVEADTETEALNAGLTTTEIEALALSHPLALV